MTYQSITYEIKEHVAWLTLNRPDSFNAINLELARDFTKALQQSLQGDLSNIPHEIERSNELNNLKYNIL
ncbi:enoyl-CoA hydratase/isomerase family protein [Desulfallas thermosapovorans]|uniref:Enoyl-CoA hydratase n=1 Tax=Desulfallas thermosapovorans DSM 6562 TaxID=1121431 RepID=A0A5S4ZSQ9_9FIRM|nr:enoyl-CoA hydratase/isomerase family protein [Desulfallas thermosapovorans]TYO95986.1 hypothetical protein LX24_01376 [Desulfallas thermosapovorans DSM 6562]